MSDELLRFARACSRVHDAVVHVDTPGMATQPTKFVLLGSLGNRDYVRVFELFMRDTPELIDLLCALRECRVEVGRIDAPGDMGFLLRDAVAQRPRVQRARAGKLSEWMGRMFDPRRP